MTAKPPAPHEPTWWQALLSVLAAAFGVQSSKNRRRDFSAGSPWKFIFMGVIMTLAFVITLILIVHAVLPK